MLQLKDLTFSYEEPKKAVDHITLSVVQGESIGIIGANGAGKSTLLHLLTGVLTADSGTITVEDILLSRRTLAAVRQRLGLVFQDPDDQLFMPTIYDDVAFGPRNMGLSEDKVVTSVIGALNQVGIAHLQDRPAFRLSGGEKRAAAIACVLSMQPDILILDEPTASLDPGTRRRIINLLRQIGRTRIMTSHDLDMIWETCSRTLVLDRGRIIADGPTERILTDAVLMESAGLELPLFMQHPHPAGAR